MKPLAVRQHQFECRRRRAILPSRVPVHQGEPRRPVLPEPFPPSVQRVLRQPVLLAELLDGSSAVLLCRNPLGPLICFRVVGLCSVAVPLMKHNAPPAGSLVRSHFRDVYAILHPTGEISALLSRRSVRLSDRLRSCYGRITGRVVVTHRLFATKCISAGSASDAGRRDSWDRGFMSICRTNPMDS